MKTTCQILIAVLLIINNVTAYSLEGGRRAFLSKSLATGAAAVTSSILVAAPSSPANADDDPYKDFITSESGLRYKVRTKC